MIAVTRLNGSKFFVNAELVRTVEGTPDTVITLTTDERIIVRDNPQAVVAAIIEYQRSVRQARVVEKKESK
ncbi:MAG: endoflagellar protein [Chloroflexi bacterium]|nr:MAG: endoflagellar protein [Chloroflexota bacterium]MBL1194806.1 endoflagellar protein [Chloroflexota bacterium]NOH12097.1 flagellar FlbD family protein [Chloroflexota bacterium]